nr:hypothetical protein [uncultured Stomatobaculum sp.]
MGLGGDIRIVSPPQVVAKMTDEVQRLAAQYPQKKP